MIEIREATSQDVALMLPLVLDMERHYEGDLAIGADLARARLARMLAADAPGVIFVAVDGAAVDGAEGPALGFATLFQMAPGKDMAPTCFLKELYVAEAARGRGVGERLMRAAGAAAVALGAERMDLTTATDNVGGRRFYERLGGVAVPAALYRYQGDALARLADD